LKKRKKRLVASSRVEDCQIDLDFFIREKKRQRIEEHLESAGGNGGSSSELLPIETTNEP
jgi:hypothetical protein